MTRNWCSGIGAIAIDPFTAVMSPAVLPFTLKCIPEISAADASKEWFIQS